LAEAATPDQETTARIDTHSSAILKTQQHLLHLRDLASKFENNVGRRLQVAQSDPRKLTISCGDFIDKLTKTDGHWKSAITGFCRGLLQHDSRIFTDKNIIIYDDMTRSAGTLIKAAELYLQSGAKTVSAVLSHLSLNNKKVAQALIDSNIKFIVATNSHPASQWKIVRESPKFKILDVSEIFINTVYKVLS
jgi:hypothetical protein